MANRINNKYDYRSGLLGALNVQHNASDVRNEDEYRKKVLNGLGVEYTEDDINQKNLYRAKVVEGLASSGGGGTKYETVFEGSVTTAKLSPTMKIAQVGIDIAPITADTIKVTFNGTEYECNSDEGAYGAPFIEGSGFDFSEYPFRIEDGSTLITPEAGTYSLKIEEPQSGGESDFSTAVVIVEGEDEIAAPVIMFEDTPPYLSATSASGEFTVALYKGRAFCTYYGDKKVTVSGNAEVYGSGVIVTGDCTITLS